MRARTLARGGSITSACVYENEPYELGVAFASLKSRPGATITKNNVTLGTFISFSDIRLGCRGPLCENRCRSVDGFSCCRLMVERIRK